MSPLSHGPYFIISTIHADCDSVHPIRPAISQIDYILVPFDEIKEMLENSLQRLIVHGLISQHAANEFKEKCVSYDEFLQILQNKNTNVVGAQALQEQKKRSTRNEIPHAPKKVRCCSALFGQLPSFEDDFPDLPIGKLNDEARVDNAMSELVDIIGIFIDSVNSMVGDEDSPSEHVSKLQVS